MMKIHVISNIFNFMAERTIDSFEMRCDVTHINKTPFFIRDFQSPWVDKIYEEKGRSHHDMIKLILMREDYKENDVVFFVDHDICFEKKYFQEFYHKFDNWFSEDPDLLIASTKYEFYHHDNDENFRTTPFFAVRKNTRTITDKWRPLWTKNKLHDTGRLLFRELEREGKARFSNTFQPPLHLHHYWRLNESLGEHYERVVRNILIEGCFSPSEKELQMMEQYPNFKLFLENRKKTDYFKPI